MSTRFALAWQTRHDLHAWIKAHPDCTMPEMCAAFPEIKFETMRMAMRRLRADLEVVMVNGRSNRSRYRAITEQIRPLADTIERLREAGRKNNQYARLAKQEKPPVATAFDDPIAELKAELKALEKARRQVKRQASKAARAAKKPPAPSPAAISKAAKRAASIEKNTAIEEAARNKAERRGVWREDGSYTHVPGIHGQPSGGQGSLRQRVSVNCFQLF